MDKADIFHLLHSIFRKNVCSNNSLDWIKGKNCPPKDTLDLPCLLQLLTLSDFNKFWNHERWGSLNNSLPSSYCRNLFQNGANDIIKTVEIINYFLSKKKKKKHLKSFCSSDAGSDFVQISSGYSYNVS